MNIFTNDFINQTKIILKNNVTNHKTFFKKDLVKELGFNIFDKKEYNIGIKVVTLMFDLNYLPDWQLIPGKFGGIAPKDFAQSNTNKSISVEFLKKLFKILNENCSENPIPRKKIAELMNLPISNKEACGLITKCLQKNYIIGFKGKIGKNGGIIRIPSISPRIAVETCQAGSVISPCLPSVSAIQDLKDGALWSSAPRLQPTSESVLL